MGRDGQIGSVTSMASMAELTYDESRVTPGVAEVRGTWGDQWRNRKWL